jgi:acyl-coenzyme A thioesterase PaaI-like protein
MLALTNDTWGFATNCFVCEARNDAGLRIPFFHDTDAGIVIADFVLDGRFSGAPSWAHGGVSLAICDEAMAWAAIAIHHKWAVTKSSNAEFERPVVIGKPYRCEARIDAVDDASIETSARIVSVRSERVCVRMRATMSVVTALQAPAMGIDPTGVAGSYLSDASSVDSGP